MREGQPHVIHLKDYVVPGYLIEQTALDVELGEEETRVRASLTMKQNPEGRRETRLVLDGSTDLATQLIAIDGRELSHNEYAIEDGKLCTLLLEGIDLLIRNSFDDLLPVTPKARPLGP